jgi:phospholipase/carboxylesterase
VAKTHLFKSHFIAAAKRQPWAQRKLMVVLHGRGDSLRPFLSFDLEMDMPEMNYLLLNAPYRFDDGYKWCGLPPYQERGILEARAKLFRLLDDLQLQGYRSHNIFLFGFSEGCLIASDVGLHYPHPLGGVIGVSGCLHFFSQWKRKLAPAAIVTPWLFTHGHRDDVIRLKATRGEVDRLNAAGLNAQWVEFNKKHEIEYVYELPLIREWMRARYLHDTRLPNRAWREKVSREESAVTWAHLPQKPMESLTLTAPSDEQ